MSEHQGMRYRPRWRLILLTAALMLLAGACLESESYEDSEYTPCEETCDDLLECSGDDFYDFYTDRQDCADECADIEHDAEMKCIMNCSDQVDDCTAFRDCVLGC